MASPRASPEAAAGASSAVGAKGVYSEGCDSLVPPSALESFPKTASKLSCATSQPSEPGGESVIALVSMSVSQCVAAQASLHVCA
jgi:hypothetical protein